MDKGLQCERSKFWPGYALSWEIGCEKEDVGLFVLRFTAYISSLELLFSVCKDINSIQGFSFS